MGGRGAEEVAKVVEDRAEIRSLVESVREGLRPQNNPLEVDIELPPTPKLEEQDKPQNEKDDDEAKKVEDGDKDDDPVKPPKRREVDRTHG